MTAGQSRQSLRGLGDWILGQEGARVLSTLWEGLGHPIFSLKSFCGEEFTRGALVTDRQSLRRLDEHLKKTPGAFISTQVLINVQDDFRFAGPLLEEAKGVLRESSPWIAALYRKMVEAVVPVEHADPKNASRQILCSAETLGLIFTTFLERKTKFIGARRAMLAVDVAQEVGHHALLLYGLGDSLCRMKDGALVKNTLGASVGTAYRIATCFGILHDRKQSSADEKVFALASLSDLEAEQRSRLKNLRENATFTPLGERIMSDLEKQVEALKVDLRSRSAPRAGLGYVEMSN